MSIFNVLNTSNKLLLSASLLISSLLFQTPTVASEIKSSLEVEGKINAILFSKDQSLLIASTSLSDSKALPKSKNYGINVFKRAGHLEYKKTGFLSTEIGKPIDIDKNLIVFHRVVPKLLLTQEQEKNFPSSIKIISIENPAKPEEISATDIPGFDISALNSKRKLIAVSNGEEIEFLSYKDPKNPNSLAKFSVKDQCQSAYTRQWEPVRYLEFSEKGNQLNVLAGATTLCSYDIKSVSDPKLVRGGHIGWGSKMIAADKLILIIGERSPASTIVYRDIAGKGKYDLAKVYDVIQNIPKDSSGNAMTASFKEIIKHNNYLIVNSDGRSDQKFSFIVYDIKKRNKPKIVGQIDNEFEFNLGAIAVSADMKHLLIGLQDRIIFTPLKLNKKK